MTIRVFNVLGQEIAVLVDENQIAGRHSLMFDAGRLPSGVYLFSMESPGFSHTRRLVLVK